MTPDGFWEKVDKTESCWVWLASVDHNGYGQVRIGRTVGKAHQISYIEANGPIPPGLELDHLCRNRWCVNPDHLEPVTHAENMRRSVRLLRSHCRSGHVYDEANTRWYRGRRTCRACHAAESSRRYHGRKAAAS